MVTFTSFLLMDFFGEGLIIPPLIEESSKLLALTLNIHFAITYTLIFSVMEFVHYYQLITESTGSFDIKYLIMRSICVILHFIYLYVQIIGFKLYYKTEWKGCIILSFIMAWLLHVAWNGFFGKLVFVLIQM